MPRKSPPPASSLPAPPLSAPAHPALPALTAPLVTPAEIEGDLDARLDFTPVPRGAKRWNGLTELKQRTFIQLLADSGSVTMAAKTIGTTTSAM